MKRKFMSLVLASAMICTVLAGCGSSSGTASSAASQTSETTESAASEETSDTTSTAADTEASGSTETAPVGNTVEISLADAQPDGCAANLSLKAFIEEVKEKSGGTINITYYPNSQLGNERDLAEGVQQGTVDMAYVSTAVMQNFDDRMAIFSLPYIFTDYDHVHAFAESDYCTEVFDSLDSAINVKTLGLFDQGFRWIWTTEKEIKTLEDLKGLKIRTPESDVYTETFTLLGTNPTPMSFGDLFTALQTGVVEGYEVNPESTWQNGTYEALKYGLKSNHIYAGSVVFISQNAYDRMDDDQKAIFNEAIANAVEYNNQIAKENEDTYTQNIEDAGIVINDLSDEERQKFADAVKPLYDSYYDLVGGQEFVEAVQNMEY